MLFLAKGFAKDETYSGGGGDQGTNNFLRKRGFAVRLKSSLEQSEPAIDIMAVIDSNVDETTKKRLIDARLGQGGFREELLESWSGKCALTMLSIRDALRASHIKPWRDSTNTERLDSANGLLLSANLDALFDRHLISFDSAGCVIVNSTIDQKSLLLAGLKPNTRISVSEATRKYMQHHTARFHERKEPPYQY